LSLEAQHKKLVKEIQGASRQEERIARLLDAILRDRASGLDALDTYRLDKAKFASYALEQIRTLFSDTEINLKDELIVAALIQRFFLTRTQ
jgi:hypothetical protein